MAESAAEMEETLQWIKDWREGMFSSSSRDEHGWPIELHGLAESYENLAAALVAESQRKDEALRKIEAICAAAPSGGTGLLNAMLHVLELSRAALKDPEGVQAARGAAESGSGEPRRANARSAPSGTAARGPEPEPPIYRGTFELAWLGEGERVTSAGDGTGAAIIVAADGSERRVNIGDSVAARGGPEPETKP